LKKKLAKEEEDPEEAVDAMVRKMELATKLAEDFPDVNLLEFGLALDHARKELEQLKMLEPSIDSDRENFAAKVDEALGSRLKPIGRDRLQDEQQVLQT